MVVNKMISLLLVYWFGLIVCYNPGNSTLFEVLMSLEIELDNNI